MLWAPIGPTRNAYLRDAREKGTTFFLVVGNSGSRDFGPPWARAVIAFERAPGIGSRATALGSVGLPI